MHVNVNKCSFGLNGVGFHRSSLPCHCNSIHHLSIAVMWLSNSTCSSLALHGHPSIHHPPRTSPNYGSVPRSPLHSPQSQIVQGTEWRFPSRASWFPEQNQLTSGSIFSPQFLANIYHIIPHLNITGAGHSFEQSNEGYEYFNPGFNLAKTNLRVPAKNSWHYFLIWLVVYLPLWKIWVRQLGSIIIFPTEWKKEFLFQTTNQW